MDKESFESLPEREAVISEFRKASTRFGTGLSMWPRARALEENHTRRNVLAKIVSIVKVGCELLAVSCEV